MPAERVFAGPRPGQLERSIDERPEEAIAAAGRKETGSEAGFAGVTQHHEIVGEEVVVAGGCERDGHDCGKAEQSPPVQQLARAGRRVAPAMCEYRQDQYCDGEDTFGVEWRVHPLERPVEGAEND